MIATAILKTSVLSLRVNILYISCVEINSKTLTNGSAVY
jgi:hypothetical protein